VLGLALSLFVGLAVVRGAVVSEGPGGRLTRITKGVQLAPVRNAPLRTASLHDRIADGGSIRTGAEARAEVTFPDGAVARFGGKSVGGLGARAQVIELKEGAVLFQAPKGTTRMKVETGGITVEARGTTGIMERHENLYVKILVLEGTARVFTNKVGESILVTPGQMLITKPGTTTLPEAVHFDLGHLYKTSLLVNAGFAPLARKNEILRAIKEQESDPALIRTNLVIYGRGTLVNLVAPTPAASPSARAASSAAAQASPGLVPTTRRK